MAQNICTRTPYLAQNNWYPCSVNTVMAFIQSLFFKCAVVQKQSVRGSMLTYVSLFLCTSYTPALVLYIPETLCVVSVVGLVIEEFRGFCTEVVVA